MATDLGQLVYTLTLNDEGFTDQVETASAGMDDLSAQAGDTSAAVDKLAASSADSGAALDEMAGSATAAGGATVDAGAAADEASGGFSLFGGSMLKTLAPLAALFIGFEGLKAVFDDAKQQSDQWNSANAQIVNSLKNTHDAVGMNVSQLDDMAEATAKNTTFTKSANLTIESSLVTLQGMNKDVMPQAVTLTDDLATKMAELKGQSVPSLQQTSMAAKAMAKALEDPTTATAAFTRAGVTLTSTQVAQIKAMGANTDATDAQALSIKGVTAAGAKALSNWSSLTAAQQSAATKADGLTAAQITQAKAFGTANAQTAAQKQLMSDLSGYVGGAASAATQTFSGKITELKNTIADSLIPFIQSLEKDLEKAGVVMLNVGGQVIAFLKPAFDSLFDAIKGALPTIERLVEDMKPLAEIIGITLVVAIDVLVKALTIVIKVFTDVTKFILNHRIVLAGLIGIVAGVAVAYAVTLLGALITLAPVLLTIISTWIAANVAWAISTLAAIGPWILIGAVIAAIAYEVITHWSDVKQWFDDFWNWIKGIFDDIVGFIKKDWEDIVLVLLGPIGLVLLAWKLFHDQIIAMFEDAVHMVEGVWDDIVGFFSTIITDIKNAIVNGVKDFGTLLYDAGKDLIQGLINGVKDMADAAGNAVKDVGKGITDVAKKILGVFSPSTVFAEIGQNVTQGLAQGISSNADSAVKATNDLTTGVVAAGTAASIPTVNNSSSSTTGDTNYNFAEGSVVLSTPEAVDEFFNIGNRNTALELNGGSPLAGTTGV